MIQDGWDIHIIIFSHAHKAMKMSGGLQIMTVHKTGQRQDDYLIGVVLVPV